MRTRSENGSLALALLASIVVGGLVITLVGTTMVGQRQVRADRNFQTAINGADAAVQQAATVISQLPDDGSVSCASGTFGADCVLDAEFLTLDTDLGGGEDFEWTATQLSPVRWAVRGSGFVNGVERVVEAEVAQDAIFTVGAFADIGFTMRGSNFVRSYTESASDNGNGSVGSNGQIQINGNSRADVISLFGPSADCDGACGGSTTGSGGTTEEFGFSEVFDVDAIEEAIIEAMNAACDPSDFRSFDVGAGEVLQGGETYCFTQITSSNRDVLEVNATSEDPAVVYVQGGDVTFENQTRVNCPEATCGDAASRPDSAALQLYSTGRNVLFGNHSYHALAVAAPQANCSGSPSNAQATIYGALMCNDLTNQGGWDFHFDERLADIGAGQYRIKDWREEAPSGSSIPG